jgi:protein-L-isoaspartate(D-aspartate) O-methyltransferase
MQNRSENLRAFFARYVTATSKVSDQRIRQAFATVKREDFAGPGPWSIKVLFADGYIDTPDDDIAFLYQDTLVALDAKRGINIGQPSAHARWLDAVALREGETALQIGAGSGYYSAILAHLVGASGRVHAYEIDQDLALRAERNLKALPQVAVQARSGVADGLPKADVIYVCAGVTQPSWAWLDALRPGARLIFPLQPHSVMGAWGGMLMIERASQGAIWPARFVSRASFIPCTAPQDAEAGDRLAAAFAHGGYETVRSFRLDEPIDSTCWFAGDGWWLSTLGPRRPLGSDPIVTPS